jgi:hypothetical protein
MTNTSLFPVRFEVKAIRVPSGDHAGSESDAVLLVRFRWPVPDDLITNTSLFPVRFDVKAIRVPSGDHAGRESEAGLFDRSI